MWYVHETFPLIKKLVLAFVYLLNIEAMLFTAQPIWVHRPRGSSTFEIAHRPSVDESMLPGPEDLFCKITEGESINRLSPLRERRGFSESICKQLLLSMSVPYKIILTRESKWKTWVQDVSLLCKHAWKSIFHYPSIPTPPFHLSARLVVVLNGVNFHERYHVIHMWLVLIKKKMFFQDFSLPPIQMVSYWSEFCKKNEMIEGE